MTRALTRTLMIALAIVFCCTLTGCGESGPDKPTDVTEENIQPKDGEVRAAPGTARDDDDTIQTGAGN